MAVAQAVGLHQYSPTQGAQVKYISGGGGSLPLEAVPDA